MHRLIVAEEARGMGLARKLIEFAVTQSPNGYLRADTDPKNTPMRALFERLGFRDAGLLTYHEFNDLQCVTTSARCTRSCGDR